MVAVYMQRRRGRIGGKGCRWRPPYTMLVGGGWGVM